MRLNWTRNSNACSPMTGCRLVPTASGSSAGALRPTFVCGALVAPNTYLDRYLHQKYFVDIGPMMLHHRLPMARKLFAETMLRGSSSLSYVALAWPGTQPLDHKRRMARRKPANTGRPIAICR